MKSNFMTTFIAILFCSISGIANAGLMTVSGNLNVDNEFFAYISTSDEIAGTAVAQGTNWPTTNQFSFDLTEGVNYFLHIKAIDKGVIAGFLGDFALTGTDHLFSNGTQNVLTNGDDWGVSTTGWGNYVNASTYGKNGVWPWNNIGGVNTDAQWIWSSTNVLHGAIDNEVYFTLAINSTKATEANQAAQIPEPSILAIFALSLMGLSSRRFKK
jgi:hypothetical protein